jgi:hydrogenase maturation protein HypF
MPRRLRIAIQGAVQGVGFRPFVFRLAEELALRGFVQNDSRGVLLELEGDSESLTRFLERLPAEKPAHAVIHSVQSTWLEPAGFDRFEIRHSEGQGERVAAVLPDLATCADCRRDVEDPGDRRCGYPFTNCTHCGPRFSILKALPYDRLNTTMSRFRMCAQCQAEYDDPRDRRFHAQPTACPQCGPRLFLWNARGETLATDRGALEQGAAALCEGQIVALKGLGGFHLLADARNGWTVHTLRERKARWGKPLALMVKDLAAARALCEVSDQAAAILACAQAPIVLLPRRPEAAIAPEVAPETPYLGVMLPYTPLHHLLFTRIDFPLVATSGNLSEEPICTDEHEALRRLGGIADLFLVHDRPIERHVDDSVVFFLRDEARLMRRARGYAPLPVSLRQTLPPILAVGAHQKVTIALAVGRQVFLSQHIGDLENAAAFAAFERVIADFLRLYALEPAAVAHDLHPDFTTTRWARENAHGRLVPVQHHHAHLASCLAENGAEGPALGVTWDGTGLGTDGTLWGGEFLLGDAAAFERLAYLRPFRLPGGEAAVREPRRVALALLWEIEGPRALEREDLAPIRDLSTGERRVLGQMLAHSVHAPFTTSAGRLFDGVAALLGLHPRVRFEGQAAMALEHLADLQESGAYPLPLTSSRGACATLDWAPLLEALLADLRRGEAREAMAARFHNGLVGAILAVARLVGERRVALSGGCFQNRLLTERAAESLTGAGFEVLLHRQVPPNDGGLSLGQVLVAAARR